MNSKLKLEIEMLKQDKDKIIDSISNELKNKSGIPIDVAKEYLDIKINVKYLRDEMHALVLINQELESMNFHFNSIYKIICIKVDQSDRVTLEVRNIRNKQTETLEFTNSEFHNIILEIFNEYVLDTNVKYFINNSIYFYNTSPDELGTFLFNTSYELLCSGKVEFIKVN